jgi:Spy/CpxP family protein refolding chaperone
MKRTLLAIAATLLVVSTAHAQPGGWGPGMDGYGPGPAWAGMMDSYGRGPGWHGMSDGYGRGPGWQPMIGPQMGFGLDYRSLKLSDEQRDRILAIERAASGKRWEMMGRMREQGLRMHESDAAGKLDDEALRKNFLAMSEAHKAMFETSLQARKDIQAVLTPEQREQLGRRR